mgnify:CR=1 FL=1
MDNGRFYNLIQTESPYFKKILDTMYHSKVNDGCDFLRLIDNTIIKCAQYPSNCDESISLHMVYIPSCPPWAKELLVRFLIHRSTLTQDKTIIPIAERKIAGPLCLPMGMKGASKQAKLLEEERKYFRGIIRNFPELKSKDTDTKRALFVLSENDVITRGEDKNPWLSKLYSRKIDSDCATIVTTTLDAYDIEKQIEEYDEDNVPQIENVYVFHSQNKGKITSSYNIEQLQRLNQYGVGIKNIYIFYITDHPFRLYYANEIVKNKVLSHILKKEIKKYDAFDGFISFTPDEIDFLFHRKYQRHTLYIDSPERDIFTTELDAVFEQMQHNYRKKNDLSLALNNKLQEQFILNLKQSEGYVPEDLLTQFFAYYTKLWNNSVKPQIEQFIANSKHITFVLHRENKSFKAFLREQFETEERHIDVKQINAIKKGAKSECIVLFTYQYTDSTYKSFPNSFDPLPINPSQKSLTIINRLTHNNYFEWNSHYYNKDYNGFLYSDFRKKELGWNVRKCPKPIIPDIWVNIEDAESEQRDYQVEKCAVIYENERKKEYSASTKALYLKRDETYGVSTLKDLSNTDISELLVIDELVDVVNDSLISKSKENTTAEEIIRKDPKYGLTPTEINSNIELWKYLLIKKINEFGIDAVYSDIFNQSREISLRGFERWTDLSYPMILPRSRKAQNALLAYLGFTIGSPYHRIVLSKKLLSINNSRTLNSQIEALLQSLITTRIETTNDFDALLEKYSDIMTLLNISTVADANALIDLLEIKLKKIVRIEYDPD